MAVPLASRDPLRPASGPLVVVRDPAVARTHGRSRSSKTTVLVAEASPRYREWIVDAIGSRPGLQLVGEALDGNDALEQAKRLRPDVLTVAVRLAGVGGVEVARQASAGGLPTRTLVLGSPLGVATIADALDAGAWGYVWKGQDQAVIATAIEAVGRGEMFLGPRIQRELFETVRRRAEGRRLELSAAETEVLALVAEGLSRTLIAERLGLTVARVDVHLQATYVKLGVSGQPAAIATAMRRGLLA